MLFSPPFSPFQMGFHKRDSNEFSACRSEPQQFTILRVSFVWAASEFTKNSKFIYCRPSFCATLRATLIRRPLAEGLAAGEKEVGGSEGSCLRCCEERNVRKAPWRVVNMFIWDRCHHSSFSFNWLIDPLLITQQFWFKNRLWLQSICSIISLEHNPTKLPSIHSPGLGATWMGLAPVQWLTSGSLLMSENHWGEAGEVVKWPICNI